MQARSDTYESEFDTGGYLNLLPLVDPMTSEMAQQTRAENTRPPW